ncbi:MAG: hypothetical protein GTO24_21185 [candidate division Zixibacteria bacterium]|nr:hypothetical protein [candidate division Zixibacteria bacterium]
MPPEKNDEEFDWKSPEYKTLDAQAFEQEWIDWLDNPPVGWAPPKGANRIYSATLDMRNQGGFVMRYDAWVGESGIHVHTRVVTFTIAPGYVVHRGYVRRRRPRWAFWKKPETVLVMQDEEKVDYKIISKHIVGSFVVPWEVWSLFEELRFDPRWPPRPNGKGWKPE